MPPHAYVPAVAGCWALFGEVQADEMMRFRYPDAHAIVVDAYMASHPGDGTDRREAQSVVVHLVGLCGLIERGRDSDVWDAWAAEHHAIRSLLPPSSN